MTRRIIALILVLITVFSIGVFADSPFVIAKDPFAAQREAAALREVEAKKEVPRVFAQGYVDAYKVRLTKIPALMYHKITDNPDEVTDWVITGEMLAADFAEIKKRGYTPITVAEYHNIKKAAINNPTTLKMVLLPFVFLLDKYNDSSIIIIQLRKQDRFKNNIPITKYITKTYIHVFLLFLSERKAKIPQ